jgi:3-oxoacyl-[acyl-carrier-protein] synthase-1
MMREGFAAGSANLERLDDEAADLPVIRASRAATLDTVLSNSFGFGGTNASLLLRRWQGE